MKKLILIVIIILIPVYALALDQMKDNELDQITARFGVGAAQDAAPLAAPAGDVNATAGNITPVTPPASRQSRQFWMVHTPMTGWMIQRA